MQVWASTDRRSAVFGGAVGAVMITIAVFIVGFGGWLAAWAGYVTWETNPNLFLFQVSCAATLRPQAWCVWAHPTFGSQGCPWPRDRLFAHITQLELPSESLALSALPAPSSVPLRQVFRSQRDADSSGASVMVQSAIGVIVLILAAIMNESAIDSIQNGITSVLTQHFFRGQHTIFPRIVLFCVNVPLFIISLQGGSALTNASLVCTSTIPLARPSLAWAVP